MTWDSEAAKELEALLDDIHGKDRPTQGNGTYRERQRMGCECGHAFGDHEIGRCLVPGCDCVGSRLAAPLKPTSGCACAHGYVALECPEHGVGTSPLVSAALKDVAPVWTHDEDGSYAEFSGYHLHVTSDGDVWLNTEVAAFDGICLGARLGEHQQPVKDAISTLEHALARLRTFKNGAK